MQTTWTSKRTALFLVAMVCDEASFYGRLLKHALPGGTGWRTIQCRLISCPPLLHGGREDILAIMRPAIVVE